MALTGDPGQPAATPGAAVDARAAGRGVLSLFALQTLARALGLLFVVTVARAVAPEEFARYSVLTGVVLFGSLLADFGTTTVITRVISRDRESADRWLSGTLPASFAFGLAAYAAALAFATVAGYSSDVVIDVAVGGLALPLVSSLTSVLGALDGAGMISTRAVLSFVQTAGITVGGAVPVLLGGSIRTAAIALPVSAAVTLVAAMGAARRRRLWSGRARLDAALTRQLLHAALPFAALAGLGAVYRRLDLLVLSLMGTGEETAAYDLALRVIEAVGYLGAVVSAPALFIFSRRLGSGDRDGAQRAFTTAARAVYLVGLPAAAGLVALHQPLVRTFFGRDYAAAAVPLAILGGQLWLDFVGGLQGALVIAGDNLRRAVRLELMVMSLLVVLDVVLIARWGGRGAAAAIALFQVVNVAVFRRFNRTTSGVTTPLPPARFVLAAAACGLAAWPAGQVALPLGIAAGGVAYATVLLATRAVTSTDVDVIRRLTGSDARA